MRITAAMWIKDVNQRAGRCGLAAGQSVSLVRPVSPLYNNFVFCQKIKASEMLVAPRI